MPPLGPNWVVVIIEYLSAAAPRKTMPTSNLRYRGMRHIKMISLRGFSFPDDDGTDSKQTDDCEENVTGTGWVFMPY